MKEPSVEAPVSATLPELEETPVEAQIEQTTTEVDVPVVPEDSTLKPQVLSEPGAPVTLKAPAPVSIGAPAPVPIGASIAAAPISLS